MSEPIDFEERPRNARSDRDDRPREPVPRKNGIATASLVLGILSLCGGITALPGIICGIIGITRSKARGTGQGAAIAGLVMSIIGMVLVVPLVMIGLLLPAVQKVRESASRMQSSNNLKQIGLGMQNYDSAQGQLPPQAVCDKNGKKLLSWRVEILPYVEQSALYNQFKRDEPWDSPANKPLIAQMPKLYMKPGSDPSKGETYYKVFTGKSTSFTFNDASELRPFKNPWSIASLTSSARGTSNLIFCIEGGDPVIWTKPDDFDCEPNQPLPDFKPQYAGGIMVLMGDGRVSFVRKGYRESAMRASIEPNSSSRESIDQ